MKERAGVEASFSFRKEPSAVTPAVLCLLKWKPTGTYSPPCTTVSLLFEKELLSPPAAQTKPEMSTVGSSINSSSCQNVHVSSYRWPFRLYL